MSGPLPQAALRLAASGLFVFPCNGGKAPAIPGPGGHKDASREPATVREMFARRGAALIGVATEASGLSVIDVDVKNEKDGRLWYHANKHGLQRTLTHRTRSGGAHLIYSAGGTPIPSRNGYLAPGVDTKSAGGFIIWPSGLDDGYSVLRDLPLAPLPEWVREAFHSPPAPQPAPIVIARTGEADVSRYGAGALGSACERIAGAGFGSQQETLNSESYWIGRLVGAGVIPEAEARGALVAAGLDMPNQAGREAWKRAQIERVVKRAIDAGKARPRPMPTTSTTGGRADAR